MRKTKVLFLCTGNSARSQMAEALLRRYAGWFFEVYSAGLQPRGIHPFTVLVMREIGIDLSKQRSKPLTDYLGHIHFSYLITVCSKAETECPTFPGMGQRLYWPFDDPVAFNGTTGEKLEKFRQVRQQINNKIRDWLQNRRVFIQEPEPPLLI